MTVIKETNYNKCCDDVEKLEPSYLADHIIKWHNCFIKQFHQKLNRVTILPRNCTTRHIPKTNENINLYKVLYTNVHNSFILTLVILMLLDSI